MRRPVLRRAQEPSGANSNRSDKRIYEYTNKQSHILFGLPILLEQRISMKVNLKEKFSQFHDHWHPRIIGELNGQQVKIAKVKGEFPWHKHDQEDELFLVIKGELTLEFKDKKHILKAGEMIFVPRDTEHKPSAKIETQIMLFEPSGTLNTGSEENEFTRKDLEVI